MRQPSGEGKMPEVTVAQAQQQLASIRTTGVFGLRDRAVLGTLVYTGARVGALSRLRIQDLRDRRQDRFFCPVKYAWLTDGMVLIQPIWRTSSARLSFLEIRRTRGNQKRASPEAGPFGTLAVAWIARTRSGIQSESAAPWPRWLPDRTSHCQLRLGGHRKQRG